MRALEKISSFAGKYMAVISLVCAVFALFVPQAITGWLKTSWVNPLLMIVMFGMGLTTNAEDFVRVLKRPKDILIGFCSQFLIMPLLAIALGKIFRLEDALLIGVVLVGTCPGGTSSNVMTFLAKGDVPLSISMTCVSTLCAPFMTPLLAKLLLSTTINVAFWPMFVSIIKVVLLPIALGLVINHFFGKQTKEVRNVLPLISVTAICMIIMAVVAASHKALINVDPATGRMLGPNMNALMIIPVVILHNCLGYLLGYLVACAIGLNVAKRKALSIEVGMQNSGLATSLARTSFPDMALATVPGAVFSVWHNFSGSLLANFYASKLHDPEEEAKN